LPDSVVASSSTSLLRKLMKLDCVAQISGRI
jgi:hypothetical protein